MKKLYNYWIGENLRTIYPNSKRWYQFASIKYHFFLGVQKSIVVGSFISILLVAGAIGRLFFPHTVEAEPRLVEVDNLSIKVQELKNEVLADLKKCESAGYKESDGIIIFDTNNKASIGSFQFQKATVQHYYKTLFNQTITAKEAVLIALDDEKAQKLAEKILFQTDKGYTNWINCTNKHDLKSKISFIKKLEK